MAEEAKRPLTKASSVSPAQQKEADLFHTMLTDGMHIEVEQKSRGSAAEWKPVVVVYSATSGALENRDRNGELVVSITLREFSVANSASDNTRFHIKTPNKLYHVRTNSAKDAADMIGFLAFMERSKKEMDSHARLLGALPVSVAAREGAIGAKPSKDAERPAFWILPSEST